MIDLSSLSNLLLGIAFVSISVAFFVVRRTEGMRFSRRQTVPAVFILASGAALLLGAAASFDSSPTTSPFQAGHSANDTLLVVMVAATAATAALLASLVSKITALVTNTAHIARSQAQKIATVQDELLHARATMKEFEQRKVRLLENVSRDLWAPLALVLGLAEKLLGTASLADDARRDAGTIARNAQGLLERLDDLVDAINGEVGEASQDSQRRATSDERHTELRNDTLESRALRTSYRAEANQDARRAARGSESPSPATAVRGPRADRAPALDASARATVLVIEKDGERSDAVDTLAARYRMERAFDGEEGLSKTRALRPDVVVADAAITMPSGAGMLEAFRHDRALDAIPVVVVTAEGDDARRRAMLRAGAQDYLTRPFSAEELCVRVHNLVSLKRARDVLQAELSSEDHDIESLALDLRSRKRELTAALDALSFARDRAAEASQLKTNFLAMVSHELRTPLTAMQLLVDRLFEAADLPPRQRQLLERLGSSTSRLTDLVDTLLHYARIQSGKLDMNVEPFDLGVLVNEAAEELRPQAERRSLVFVTEPAAGRVTIESDPKLVRLVVVNLVANAVKFTEHGSVVVHCESRGDRRIVTITDSGPGIAPDQCTRIFEPFQQLEPTKHKHLPGVGLGLSLAQQIVDNLGGVIAVRSEIGKGSTFEVSLPKQPASRPRDAQPMRA